MAIELEIRGAEKLAKLAKRLKETGDKGLRKELYAGLQRAGKPAKDAIKPNVASELPKGGGFAMFESGDLKVSLRTRSGGRNPAVTIWSKSPHDIRKLDKGNLRHPVYGNRKKWVAQSIPAGAFTDPIKERAPVMRLEMNRVIRDVARKVERGA